MRDYDEGLEKESLVMNMVRPLDGLDCIYWRD